VTPPDFSTADEVMREGVDRVFPAAQLVLLHAGQTALSAAYGCLDPDTRECPARPDTLFDLASVSKLFTVAAFMTLVEEGSIGLDQPVREVLPELAETRPIQPYEDPSSPGDWVQVGAPGAASEVDARRVTFRHLLAHNSGLPAWRPLYRETSAEAAMRMALHTFFSYPIGARVVYSDIGLILLGLAIERLSGHALEAAIGARVLAPLGLSATRYLPVADPLHPPEAARTRNVAPTEICAWRGRRIAGQVHDENAARIGGVAGHAGLFSTADEVARFGQTFLNGGALLKSETVAEMTRVQAQDGDIRRGLGFALWSPDPEASGNPFGPGAFGHTGFTGTSLWIDPKRNLVVVALTNRVYYGRDAGGILEFRVALHRAIAEAVDA
jgi:CubicO group peptidase (beta-lactamase class C family)